MRLRPDYGWMRKVERAADEMRRGRPVLVQGADTTFLALALEHAQESESAGGNARAGRIILPAAAAAHMGYATGSASAVAIAADLRDMGDALTLALPAAQGTSQPLQPDSPEVACRMLVRFSGLAPAALITQATEPERAQEFAEVSAEDIFRYARLRPALERVTPSPVHLPLAASEQTQLLAYRDTLTQATHLALIIGDALTHKSPLVRLHSSCLTGDVLGSLRCECGDQLRAALKAIGDAQHGILLYLNQEGRGIGLTNKLRAYALQDQGLDTVDANLMLGFAADERDFSIAALILRSLGVQQLRLLTNNPAKVESLKREGLVVTERAPLKAGAGAHNASYLATKATRLKHWL